MSYASCARYVTSPQRRPIAPAKPLGKLGAVHMHIILMGQVAICQDHGKPDNHDRNAAKGLPSRHSVDLRLSISERVRVLAAILGSPSRRCGESLAYR